MKSTIRGLLLAAVVSVSLVQGRVAWGQVNCGTVLSNNTVLSEDLVCEGPGLVLGANGITLDCNGHTITGADASFDDAGLRVEGVRDVTVRGCAVAGFGDSLTATDAPNLTLLEDTFTGSLGHAVLARSSPSLTIQSCRLEAPRFIMLAQDCPALQVLGSHWDPTIVGQGQAASASCYRCPATAFVGNTSTLGLSLFVAYDCDDLIATDNELGGASGISAFDCSRVSIARNRLGPVAAGSWIPSNGLSLRNSTGSRVIDNVIEGRRFSGIYLSGDGYGQGGSPSADGNVISGNRIDGSSDGVLIIGGSDNRVDRNTITRSDIGILVLSSTQPVVRSDRNLLTDNIVQAGFWGIVAADSAGNQFARNVIDGAWIGVSDYLLNAPDLGPNIYRENEITNSKFWGLIALGSSPTILGNQFLSNGMDMTPLPPDLDPFPALLGNRRGAIAFLPFAGDPEQIDDGNPLNDFVPAPMIGSPAEPNLFRDNGDLDIYALDAPLSDWREFTDNSFESPSFVRMAAGLKPRTHARVQQDWFGLARVENQAGQVVPDALVSVRNASGRPVGSFISGADGFAPSGIDPLRPQGTVSQDPGGSLPPWPRFTEYVVDRAGQRVDLTPHVLEARSADGGGHGTYSWDGIDNDPDGYQIIGGRYQIAGVRLGNACSSFSDLRATITAADIPNEGTKQSLLAKVDAAERGYQGRAGNSGNILCSLLSELNAQRDRSISSSTAGNIAACLRETAGSLGILLPCENDSKTRRRGPRPKTVILTSEP